MNLKTSLQKFENAKSRRKFIEEELHIDLSQIENFSFSEDSVKNKNIENLIGGVSIPLGVAGPLKINGKYAKGDFLLPLATSEGALIASVSRGCKAIGDGVCVRVENVGITRGAVYLVNSLEEGDFFKNWLAENFNDLKNLMINVSSHLELKSCESEQVGKNFYVRFQFDTQDAMGMNMSTSAVYAISQHIQEKISIKCTSIAGNYDLDKKPSWLNFIKGRGKKVWAEAVISRKTVEEVLKTTPEKIVEVGWKKNILGSALSGSLGFNAHFANVVAALFCATGQDLAHVGEGSVGVTTTELSNTDLYISVFLPDLIEGVVGGGTSLPGAKSSLKILGIPDERLKNGEQVLKFAEITGAAVLAGELSLLAALSSGDLAKAHEKLGKGKIK